MDAVCVRRNQDTVHSLWFGASSLFLSLTYGIIRAPYTVVATQQQRCWCSTTSPRPFAAHHHESAMSRLCHKTCCMHYPSLYKQQYHDWIVLLRVVAIYGRRSERASVYHAGAERIRPTLGHFSVRKFSEYSTQHARSGAATAKKSSQRRGPIENSEKQKIDFR